ncbi:5-formyltetrahydrofolate cyclo-ligase [Phenylobacterium sp. J367]|uniref:5-formyltetrahydrofolate cyclo-ligase n=1 Tax=Phenylobacterium sp. J367 TaxID=2898435 RepID=UPI0021519346|nr:5-formyltetrahydrofolate cyclo-ligase [Phenylobacterium sp. J367]MCR5877872.1 5-formyltetrahydrofolate cyclo-ligase [Phenylobacterium sp. J367]
MDSTSDKTALRRRLRTLRRELAAAHPGAAEAAALRLPLDRLPEFQSFSGYHPMGSEIDPAPLMRRLAETGAVPALPVAESLDAPLEFRELDPALPLEADAAGVPGPPLWSSAVVPDLVITPLLAFDRRGRRLGQGGGHYDRTLANLRAIQPVFVLGLAYAGQEVDALPDEAHDQRLDAILTDAEWIEVR